MRWLEATCQQSTLIAQDVMGLSVMSALISPTFATLTHSVKGSSCGNGAGRRGLGGLRAYSRRPAGVGPTFSGLSVLVAF